MPKNEFLLMMSKRLCAIMVLFMAAALAMKAQWDVQFTDFTALKSFYNPATSGTDGNLNVNAAYSVQMAGYDDAPQTLYAGVDMPAFFLGPRHGVGVNFLSDKAGMFSTTRIGLQYAYNIKVGKKGRLAVGFQGALLSMSADAGGFELEDNSDPAFPSAAQDGSKVDMGAGLFFYHPRYWLGASSLHLLAPTVNLGEQNNLELPRMYYLMGGCNIKIKNSLISVQPAFMVQSDLDSWREDVQCKVAYENEGKRFYAGLGYSPDISATLMMGGVFHGISLGYSYQMYTSGAGLIKGSHEVVLGYQADLDMFKKGRNKHKSVRWL